MQDLAVAGDARVAASLALAFVEELLLAAGTEQGAAADTARGLCSASLRGTDSHGIRLLPHYLRAVQGGRVNPHPFTHFERTTPATGRLDADHGFGHHAGVRAMEEAIALAKEAGTGFVSVQNSSHCGAMAYFGLMACEHDMIGLAMTHASPKLLTPGSVRSYFGINPICVCAPMRDEEPFVYDSAPTTLTSNRLNMCREARVPLPEGVAADADGDLTTDAAIAEQLLPIGGYKGFGLAMVVDLFCGLLTSMPTGRDISMMYADPIDRRRLLGQFYGVIRIDAFEQPARFKARLQDLCNNLRRQPLHAGAKIPPMAPGDPEKHAQAERRLGGIPIPAKLLAELDACADSLGVAALTPRL